MRELKLEPRAAGHASYFEAFNRTSQDSILGKFVNAVDYD